MQTGGNLSIDIKKLQPEGVLEKVRKMREEDIRHYLDSKTGKVRKDISQHIKCYICGIEDSVKIFEKEGFDFVKCRKCGLVYVNPRPHETKVKKFYNSRRFEYQFKNLYTKSSSYRKKALYSKRMKWIESFIKTGRMLDVGSSTGHFLQVAEKSGWDVSGVEISKYAFEYSTKNLGLKNIKNCTLTEARFKENWFDVVTVWDTLEHMTDPLENVIEMKRILRPRGMVFAITPNFDSAEVMLFGKDCDTIVPDAHLIYFDLKTLGMLFEKGGFSVLEKKTSGIDIDHAIFNIKNVLKNKYDTKFLEDKKQILQEIIDLANKGNFIFLAAKKE